MNLFGPTIKSYDAFAQAVRSSGHQLTTDEAKRASTQFKVPLDDVLALREEMLKKSNAATDDAGQKSKVQRDQAGGKPLGTGEVKGGIGAAALAVRGGKLDKVDKPLTQLPKFVDVDTAAVFHGVHLSSSSGPGSFATAMLQDGKKNQITLSLPLNDPSREPTVTFLDAGNVKSGTLPSHQIGAELARSLLPLLDSAIAHSPFADPRGSGAQYGAAVVEQLREHCTALLLNAGAPSLADDKALFDKATAQFDKGNFDKGEQMLATLATGSAHTALRAQANYVLAEMHSRRGNVDDAQRCAQLALASLPMTGQVQCYELLTRLANTRRDFRAAVELGRDALGIAARLDLDNVKVNLTNVHFALGVAHKNLGEMDDAVKMMRAALESKPGATYIQLALAGYLGIAGNKAEANKMFAGIPVPPKTEYAFLDYNTNATWFHAVNKSKPHVMKFAEVALETARAFNFPGTINYFKSEPDLDWLRGDKDFQALLAKFGG